MKSREAIRKEINAQLEEPRLIVQEISRERSEHFGQVRIETTGEISVESKGPYLLFLKIEQEDLRPILDEFFETTIYITDPDLNFGADITPDIKSIRFLYDSYEKTYFLYIEYEWKEA